MSTVIDVQGLAKRYKIGEEQAAYGTLRESLSHAAKRLTGKEHTRSREDIWALKDISFQVQQGEVLGLIGRNGAGKSTLLKVLTRITSPTEGRAEIRGRVGSLLEVGTGFHPELTGRENIYLNGAILGMKRREIQQKLPEIVEFSGVSQFLDTPVKRYSSGMYVRLAFSVAAHFEPEILLVDEVLAVGDAEFQARCLGRMEDFGDMGRTVLFVSHNMQAVSQLCQYFSKRCSSASSAAASTRSRTAAIAWPMSMELRPTVRSEQMTSCGMISWRQASSSQRDNGPAALSKRWLGRETWVMTFQSRSSASESS